MFCNGTLGSTIFVNIKDDSKEYYCVSDSGKSNIQHVKSSTAFTHQPVYSYYVTRQTMTMMITNSDVTTISYVTTDIIRHN